MASEKAKELVSSNTVVVFRIVRNLANFYGFEGLICQIYCPFCVDVKKLLTELNASFKAIEIDREILQTSSIVRIVINTRTMNSSYNVSTSTLRVMTEQFLFGNRICELPELLTGGYSGGGLRRSSCMFFVRLRQLTLMAYLLQGYVAFGRFDDFNYFVAGSERYNFVQEFYNGDLQHCEITHDKRGRTAQVNIICGDCPNGRCKGGLACVCDVTLESDCRIIVELAIPCEKQGVRVFEGFTVGFHPRSWEIVFPDTGLTVTLSGSGAIGTPPTTLSPTLLVINWRCEKTRDDPYEVQITIPMEGYDPIQFTLTKMCGNTQDLRKIKEEVLLKKDPETLNDYRGGWCFGQSKKRQIKDTMNLVIKKRKEYEEKMKENGEAPVMFRCVWCCFDADLVNLSCFEVA
ncbi:hypothetical protein LXL04_024672 [Taraxacum kok-saghyz]